MKRKIFLLGLIIAGISLGLLFYRASINDGLAKNQKTESEQLDKFLKKGLNDSVQRILKKE